MKPLYTILIILAILATMWTAAAVRMQPTASATTSPVTLTQAMIDEIKPGMTVDQVQDIIGTPPTETQTGRGNFDPSKTATHLTWKAPRGSFLRASFIQGKLASSNHQLN